MVANTLAEQMQQAQASLEELESEYRPLLRLVEQLIGVVPNCDNYLEIWPTGFKTYNLLVANLLNVPLSLLGQGAPKSLVGLAMYEASRAADCMYCSAHTCSFALRRGTSPEALVGNYTSPVEAAVAQVARGMSTVPASLTEQDVKELRHHLADDEIEWIILSVGLMGFLNKFMDTMGIELEQGAIDDVTDLISSTGWKPGKHAWTGEDIDLELGSFSGRTLSSMDTEERPSYKDVPQDSLGTYLRVLRHTPSALRKDLRWTRGMTNKAGFVLLQLEQELGHAPSALAAVHNNRSIKAIATVLRENLNAEDSALGLDVKCLIALVYAEIVGNAELKAETLQLADRLAPGLSQRKMASVSRFARQDMTTTSLPPRLTTVEAGAIMLAKAAAPSPSKINPISVDFATESLSPEQIVEAVVWISVQQLLHRIMVFGQIQESLDPEL